MVLKLHKLKAGLLRECWPIALEPHGEECSRCVAREGEERRLYAGTCRAYIHPDYGYFDFTGAKVAKLFCGYLFDYYWTAGLAKQRVFLTEGGGP
jgi:hypothetical protein